MIKLLHEGGAPAWFILLFGLITLGAATRFAIKAQRHQLGFILSMGTCTLFATLSGLFMCLSAVFIHFLRDRQGFQQPDWPLYVFIGIGESISAPILGFALLSMTALLVAVGVARSPAPGT